MLPFNFDSYPISFRTARKAPLMHDPILISSQGRSGSTWLLDILDASSETHCRNEPYRMKAFTLKDLERRWFVFEDHPEFAELWDASVKVAATHTGYLDHVPPPTKSFIHPWAIRLGLGRLFLLMKSRAARGVPFGRLGPDQWKLPGLLGRQEGLEQARHVLKLVAAPGWTTWALEHRPDTLVVHLARHPLGFLNSWRNRYLARHDHEETETNNRNRLKTLIELEPEWAGPMGDPDAMSVEEAELWYWRYTIETIYKAGSGRPQYKLIRYEDLAAEPLAISSDIFAFCGLTWDRDAEAIIAKNAARSPSIANSWREHSNNGDTRLAEKVLAGSTIEDWWTL